MNGPAQKVTVTDIRIPFFRLVFVFVKMALAMIPAALIIAAIGFLVSAAGVALFTRPLGVPL
ncbi:MAG: hypothetical protein HY056_14020 [Proteobacteria bacterium]|nr:hypothetical protein [Pseudomonadota bacterium]